MLLCNTTKMWEDFEMSPSQDFLKCIEKIEKILLFINTAFEFEMLMFFVYGARKVANYVLFLK